MASEKKNFSLTTKIMVSLVLGLAVGSVLFPYNQEDGFIHIWLVEGLFGVVGAAFLGLLKMLVVPVVLISLVCGVASLESIRTLGRVGLRTLLLYLSTTAIAISIALAFASVFQPGAKANLPNDLSYTSKEAPSLGEVIVNMVPTNPVQALAEGNMLQIILFAVLLGIALSLGGEAGKRIQGIFDDLNVVVLKLVDIVIALAPYGVFALIAKTFSTHGIHEIGPLLFKYFILVVVVLFIHGLLVYPLLLKLLSALSPFPFLRKMRTAQLFAFSTASSSATIPVTLDVVETRLGIKKSIASFTVPLGATINMDGTAIMQGVATLFIAQAYGVEIGFTGLLTIVLTATLASIGTAGVPGVGLVMLAMVLTQMNLPVEGIALITGIDRLLDMIRTAVNITGDAAVTAIVARWEGAIDEQVYHS